MGINDREFFMFKVYRICSPLALQTLYFLIVLLFVAVPNFTEAQSNSNDSPVTINGKKYYKHTVLKDETIYGIAREFHLQPKDIVLENPSAIDGVNAGDVLLIPTIVAKPGDTATMAVKPPAKQEQPNQPAYIYHEVIKKETLYSLAKRNNTTVSILDSLNPQLAGMGLKLGQTIRIPVAMTQPVGGNISKEKKQLKQDSVKVVSQMAIQGTEKSNANNEKDAYKLLVTEQIHGDTSKGISPSVDTGKKLNRYNIGLIMPFASQDIDSIPLTHLLDGTGQVPFATRISVDYYHGLTLALDSLAKRGFKANLSVFNILMGPDSSYNATDFIVKNPELLEMNLIIGPAFPSNFKRVAKIAALHHIAIVSPLSGEISVVDKNPFTSKVMPSAITETEAEAEYIATHYNHANFIIIHNMNAGDEYYNTFKRAFISADSAKGGADSLIVSESAGGMTNLKAKTVKNSVNVVIMPYEGASFVAKFVNELANAKFADDNQVVLYGMQNWANNDALQPINLDTLDFHFPSNEFVNYADANTRKFIIKYRGNYLSEPSYYSYEGYDGGMFYGNMLQAYGTDIQNHLGDFKVRGLQTSFNMVRSSPENGYENKGVYIIEYKNFTEKIILQ